MDVGRRGASALSLVLVAGALAFPSSGSANFRHCHRHADFNVLITAVRDLGCRSAAREMKRYRGSISFRFRTPHGFRCKRVSGNRLGGTWRCVRRQRAFRFEFGD
jgi:hypothetical protein